MERWTEFKKRAEAAIQKMKLTEKRRDKEFWEGYLRGLRRRYYGDKFRTAKEHKELMISREEKGIGYRSGYTGETVIEAGITLTYNIYYTPGYTKQK